MWKQEDHKFKVMLNYIVNSSPLWDTWDFVSQINKQEREKGLCSVDMCSPQPESLAVEHPRVEIGYISVNCILWLLSPLLFMSMWCYG